MASEDENVTKWLQAWAAGDESAAEPLMRAVYRDLRRRAAAHLRRERRHCTLQPTELVNEAFMRLVDEKHAAWQNRAHFFAIASTMMRRILVDRARAHRSMKRSGQWARVSFEEGLEAQRVGDVDVIDLDRALQKLESFDPRKCKVAELRFFTGLSLQETADVVGISLATVERDWQAARAWLLKELSPA